MLFEIDGPIGKEVKRSTEVELVKRYPSSEAEAGDLAEYITVLMASDTDVPTIAREVGDITEISIDSSFYVELKQYVKELNQNGGPPPTLDPLPVIESPVIARHAPGPAERAPPRGADQDPRNARMFIPSGNVRGNARGPGGISKGGANGIPRGPGGITKPGARNNDRSQQRKPFAEQTQRKFEKALSSNNQNINIHNIPKGRCPDFPYCQNKECPKSHPTKNCFQYPNCPNPPGTCNYLHPDQDQDLIKKLEVSKKEFEEKKLKDFMLQQGSCKYGLQCAKENCPFAHPTPANESAKITTLDWCSDGKNCHNAQCTKAHPPPATSAFTKPAPSALELALEQCKFGATCKKPKCPRRHATSNMPCRERGACRRLDCTFSHPLNEDCRFGAACSNKYCLYKHPAERTLQSNTWVKEGGDFDSASTSQRPFAVADDQVSAFQV